MSHTVAVDDRVPLARPVELRPEIRQTPAREAIRSALAGVPANQRQPLELAYFGGLTYPEIACRLKVSARTVKRRLRHGLEQLRALLQAPCTERGDVRQDQEG